jgi:hypothetical protein
MTQTITPPSVVPPPVAPWRRLLATVAVLACVPYVVLKLAWLAGSDVGLSDDQLVGDVAMEVANAVTLAMMLAGAVLAILLVSRSRLRLPGWLVMTPMFVGTGLLGGILVLLPIQAVLGARGSAPPDQPEDPIQAWVYTVVYAGFALLGLCLLGLFAAYARERWLDAGGWRTPMRTWDATVRRQRVIAIAHGVFMVAVCTAEAVLVARVDILGGHQVLSMLMATLCLAGLIALSLRRPGGRVGTVPLVAVFVGSAAVAAWGLFFLVVFTVSNPLTGGRELPAALSVVEALRAVNGALTLLCLRALRPAQAGVVSRWFLRSP